MSTTEIEVDFETPEQAARAYYGDAYGSEQSSSDGTTDGTNESRWGDAQEQQTDWKGSWMLWYQEHVDEPRTRWFVIRVLDGQFQAIDSSASVVDLDDETPWKDVPQHDTEEAAREAYQSWLEQSSEYSDGEEDDQPMWTKWEQINEIAGWLVYQRDHHEEDRSEWLIGGVNDAGDEIFLHPGGVVESEPHVYEERQALDEALEAWLERAENGNMDERDVPSGGAPNTGQFPGDGGPRQSDVPFVGPLADAVGGPMNLFLLAITAAALLYYLEREGHIDLIDQWGDSNG